MFTEVIQRPLGVRSILLTDVGDEMCWWQLKDVGDDSGHFGDQYPQFFMSVGHQHSKDVTVTKQYGSTLKHSLY